jgi:hypothetical protein
MRDASKWRWRRLLAKEDDRPVVGPAQGSRLRWRLGLVGQMKWLDWSIVYGTKSASEQRGLQELFFFQILIQREGIQIKRFKYFQTEFKLDSKKNKFKTSFWDFSNLEFWKIFKFKPSALNEGI